MRTALKGMLVVGLVAAVAMAGAVAASAQGEGPGPGYGEGPRGQMPPRGPRTNGGLLSEYSDILHEAIADALGITETAFEQAIEGGETPFSLAREYDVDFAQLHEVMIEARAEMIEQALADEVITEEQAEWLQSRPRGPRGGARTWGRCDGSGREGKVPGWQGGPGF